METSFPSSIAVILPAWQPPDTLAGLARNLIDNGCRTLIVIDDGSSAERQTVFGEISQMRGAAVLRHAKNAGKGCALKTGFRSLLARPLDCVGVVTADADGQHTPADIALVARQLAEFGRVVLGARSFQHDVPLRSKIGNRLTQWAFRSLTRSGVSDTQTGLRGFPISLLPELMTLPGNRYEYEMAVLGYLCQTMGAPMEVPISTIYLDGNRSSHFDPLRDSLRIYRVLLRLALQKSPLASPMKEHAAS